MADVLKYTRADLASLVYHPIRPLDVVSEEIGIPVDQVFPLPLCVPCPSVLRFAADPLGLFNASILT
jgi:hypothetical protein